MNTLACPACGTHLRSLENSYELRTGRGKNIWARCKSCKAYFLAEEYSLSEEVVHTREMAWGSDDLGRFLNKFKKRMYTSVLELLLKYTPPPAFLLDVGCSYGGFLMEAQKAGYSVAGIDIVPEAVTYVNNQGIFAQLSSTIGETSIAHDDPLDIVSILDCNCYWPNQIQELKHAHRILTPGGVLVMRVVDKSWMFSLGLMLHKIHPRMCERVVWKAVNDHRFSMPYKSLLALIQDIGFETVYARPKGALHSNKSSLPVKFAFAAGDLVWRSLRVFCAPGAILLARKRLL